MKLTINSITDGYRFQVSGLSETSTVADLKLLIQELIGVEPINQRLVFASKRLDESHLLDSAGISDGATINLLAQPTSRTMPSADGISDQQDAQGWEVLSGIPDSTFEAIGQSLLAVEIPLVEPQEREDLAQPAVSATTAAQQEESTRPSIVGANESNVDNVDDQSSPPATLLPRNRGQDVTSFSTSFWQRATLVSSTVISKYDILSHKVEAARARAGNAFGSMAARMLGAVKSAGVDLDARARHGLVRARTVVQETPQAVRRLVGSAAAAISETINIRKFLFIGLILAAFAFGVFVSTITAPQIPSQVSHVPAPPTAKVSSQSEIIIVGHPPRAGISSVDMPIKQQIEQKQTATPMSLFNSILSSVSDDIRELVDYLEIAVQKSTVSNSSPTSALPDELTTQEQERTLQNLNTPVGISELQALRMIDYIHNMAEKMVTNNLALPDGLEHEPYFEGGTSEANTIEKPIESPVSTNRDQRTLDEILGESIDHVLMNADHLGDRVKEMLRSYVEMESDFFGDDRHFLLEHFNYWFDVRPSNKLETQEPPESSVSTEQEGQHDTQQPAPTTKVDEDAIVREVLVELPPKSRGEREEWASREGWYRKESAVDGSKRREFRKDRKERLESQRDSRKQKKSQNKDAKVGDKHPTAEKQENLKSKGDPGNQCGPLQGSNCWLDDALSSFQDMLFPPGCPKCKGRLHR